MSGIAWRFGYGGYEELQMSSYLYDNGHAPLGTRMVAVASIMKLPL
jgi:hypothetical protein